MDALVLYQGQLGLVVGQINRQVALVLVDAQVVRVPWLELVVVHW